VDDGHRDGNARERVRNCDVVLVEKCAANSDKATLRSVVKLTLIKLFLQKDCVYTFVAW